MVETATLSRRAQAARDGRIIPRVDESFADLDYGEIIFHTFLSAPSRIHPHFSVLHPVEPKGSFDNGDPTTTNLHLGNLSPLITEDLLCREFGVFGPIGSVKIMWPRNEEEKARNRNSGFVSFMDRKSAEKAMSMDGKFHHTKSKTYVQ
jgi:hypothetical protein